MNSKERRKQRRKYPHCVRVTWPVQEEQRWIMSNKIAGMIVWADELRDYQAIFKNEIDAVAFKLTF